MKKTTIKVSKRGKATKVNYVDNAKLYDNMLEYKEQCKFAAENGLTKPRIPEYVGESILKIANGLAVTVHFINYPFREDMVGDGIENCIMYIDNFDPYRFKNPFAYFTSIIYYAFLRRIQKEKKHLYVKHKALHNTYLFGMLEQHQLESSSGGDSKIDLDNEYMSSLVEDFEKKLEDKKSKNKKVKDDDND